MSAKRKPDSEEAPAGGFNPESAVPDKEKVREPVGPMPTDDPKGSARPSFRKRLEEAFARLKR